MLGDADRCHIFLEKYKTKKEGIYIIIVGKNKKKKIIINDFIIYTGANFKQFYAFQFCPSCTCTF